MVKLTGPMMSLSATGGFGDTIFYYDSKYGPVARKKKSFFAPPGQIWYLNNEWFKLASNRSKLLTVEQRLAWQTAYPLICDSWRDIFMGKQIEMWNMHPDNDLTWPSLTPQKVEDLHFWNSQLVDNKVYYGVAFCGESQPPCVSVAEMETLRNNTVGTMWWNVLDSASQPTDNSPYTFKKTRIYQFTLTPGHTNYLWAGVRYFNGDYDVFFLDSYSV